MFKPKDTQTTIFQTNLCFPDKLRNRLKESWIKIFRKEIMPIIPEEEFSELYSENMGRPRAPVAPHRARRLFRRWQRQRRPNVHLFRQQRISCSAWVIGG
jgi:hypothetical protein